MKKGGTKKSQTWKSATRLLCKLLKSRKINFKYQTIKTWDSVGHMGLIAAREDAFDIIMNINDIIDFGPYEEGKKNLVKNYGVEF